MSDILIIPNRGTTSAPEIQFSGSANSSASIKLQVLPEGQIAFMGKSGSLFSITDSMVGSLMAVSDISGLPILEVSSDDKVVMGTFNKPALTVTGSQVIIAASASVYNGSGYNYSLVVGNNYGTTGYIAVMSSTQAGIMLDSRTISAASGLKTDLYSSTGTVGMEVSKGSSYGGGSNFVFYYTAGATAASDTLQFQSGGSNAMTINGSQNVAIGKTSPINAKLDVNGSIIATGSLSAFTTGDAIKVRGSTGTTSLYSSIQNTSGRIIIGCESSTGNTILTGIPAYAGFIASTGFSYATELHLSAGSTSMLMISNAGNIGIATLTPNAKLDVNGNTIITGSLTVSGSDATINGVPVGKGAGSIYNIKMGISALNSSATGDYNVCIGYAAGQSITTGYSNIHIGYFGGGNASPNTGFYNVTLGSGTGMGITSGYQNTILGSTAAPSLSTGVYNTIVGSNAGYELTTSNNRNTLIGYNTGRGITTGTSNTVIGAEVTGLASNLNNTIIIADGGGNIRYYVNSSGNTAIGKTSPINATLDVNGNTIITGSLNVTNTITSSLDILVSGLTVGKNATSTTNTAVGATALNIQNSTVINNTAVGSKAGRVVSSGNSNTLLGSEAGYSLSTGGTNTFVGFQSGYGVTGGSNNTIIGYYTADNTTTGGNNTIIGAQISVGNVSNTVAVGDGQGNIRYYTDSSGNTAIGKTSPINAKLDVNGNLIVTGSIITSGNNAVYLGGAGGSSGYLYTLNGTELRINTYGGMDLKMGVAGADYITVKTGGNVGINKITPNAQLDVNGNTIITGSLTVTGAITATPDFSPIFLLMGA